MQTSNRITGFLIYSINAYKMYRIYSINGLLYYKFTGFTAKLEYIFLYIIKVIQVLLWALLFGKKTKKCYFFGSGIYL